MKKGYAHIHVILDRTGSMQSIRDDVIGGFNNYIEQQKHGPGVATLSLIQFDSQDPYEVVHDFMLLAAVPPLTAKTYVPRANTPLLDALGHGIADLQGRLGKLAESLMNAFTHRRHVRRGLHELLPRPGPQHASVTDDAVDDARR